MKTVYNKDLLSAALNYVGLHKESIIIINVKDYEDYAEFLFRTDYLEYNMYIERDSCFVAGVDTRPIIKNCNLSAGKISA